ncbi:hypothetical protein IMG5_203830 [Ichthyophthirius multifiliis]|uniref:Cyclic nucleotide-binding domain-containing protein n=1 Tax=Ichthyophthirius multifiliis TaxID=5932 RepID=G0R6C2_ICHMU|nr:hypothetical protein IMG5_203830 [Ichthyophthirius multifiliis]EGR26984.1 hypothetical protein IMG5_203830 [Ichthyophthirius multifiliis]|eukprot:XP_004023868.1 hypothetical protein IMG5_203830 [Ichthyophthirius multifiliis]
MANQQKKKVLKYNLYIYTKIYQSLCFEEFDKLKILNIIIEFFFLGDIVLRFFHEYKDHESQETVSDIRLIAKRYLKFWFWIDFTAILPFEYLVQSGPSLKLIRFFRMPKFLRLLEISKMDEILNQLLEQFSQKQKMTYLFLLRYLYKFLSFMLFAITLTYFVACIWYIVITSNIGDGKTLSFYEKFGLYNYPDSKRLIICCYFVMTTLATVGYGDFSPQTNFEKIIGIIIMILGIAFFSYIIGNFTDVLASQKKLGEGQKSSDLQRWITSLTKFNSKSLPQSLMQKIDCHFNYFWKHDRLCDLKIDDNYLQMMPKPIRKELLNYLFNDIFKLFRRFFHISDFRDSNFYYEIAFKLLPRKYNRGESILKQGDEFQEIYFILEGQVMFYFQYNGKKVSHILNRGSYFGDYNCFSGNCSEYNYVADAFVKVLAIPKHQIMKILQKYQSIQSIIEKYYKVEEQEDKQQSQVPQNLQDEKNYYQSLISKGFNSHIIDQNNSVDETLQIQKLYMEKMQQKSQIVMQNLNSFVLDLNIGFELKKFGNQIKVELNNAIQEIKNQKVQPQENLRNYIIQNLDKSGMPKQDVIFKFEFEIKQTNLQNFVLMWEWFSQETSKTERYDAQLIENWAKKDPNDDFKLKISADKPLLLSLYKHYINPMEIEIIGAKDLPVSNDKNYELCYVQYQFFDGTQVKTSGKLLKNTIKWQEKHVFLCGMMDQVELVEKISSSFLKLELHDKDEIIDTKIKQELALIDIEQKILEEKEKNKPQIEETGKGGKKVAKKDVKKDDEKRSSKERCCQEKRRCKSRTYKGRSLKQGSLEEQFWSFMLFFE